MHYPTAWIGHNKWETDWLLAGLLIISLLPVPASQHKWVAFGCKNKGQGQWPLGVRESELIRGQGSQDRNSNLLSRGPNHNLGAIETPTNRYNFKAAYKNSSVSFFWNPWRGTARARDPRCPGITACRAGCPRLGIHLSLIRCKISKSWMLRSFGKESRFFSQARRTAAVFYLHLYWQRVTPVSLQSWWTGGWILNRIVSILGTFYDIYSTLWS